MALAAAEAGGGRDRATLEIDRLDRPRVEVGVRAEPADRGDRVEGANAAGDHLREHRLEHHVVLASDQPQLHLAAPDLLPEELLERERGVDAPEAAAEDQDARGTLAHHRSSAP